MKLSLKYQNYLTVLKLDSNHTVSFDIIKIITKLCRGYGGGVLKNMFPCHFCFVKLCLDRIRYVCSIRMHKSMFFRNHRHTSLGECVLFFLWINAYLFQKTFYHKNHIGIFFSLLYMIPCDSLYL